MALGIEVAPHELLDRSLIWNQAHLLHAVGEFDVADQGPCQSNPTRPLGRS
ncbi:hypothetical protein [Streptomyces sp. NPDC058297]|uniref:hypothetical protein n=1 Tax=Streptomyces sp. NPDC058297 TaxID=3346433 RepID=UPI0036EBFEBB